MLLEAFRVVVEMPRVEVARLRLGPAHAALLARRLGSTRSSRNEEGRNRLQRVIRLVDRLFPTGSNCYRRALLETALDAGAAREPLMMGFRTVGGPGSGHAWLGSRPPAETYDVVVSV